MGKDIKWKRGTSIAHFFIDPHTTHVQPVQRDTPRSPPLASCITRKSRGSDTADRRAEQVSGWKIWIIFMDSDCRPHIVPAEESWTPLCPAAVSRIELPGPFPYSHASSAWPPSDHCPGQCSEVEWTWRESTRRHAGGILTRQREIFKCSDYGTARSRWLFLPDQKGIRKLFPPSLFSLSCFVMGASSFSTENMVITVESRVWRRNYYHTAGTI